MQNVFLIYWFIGVMFVLIMQVMGLLYKMSLGDRYIPPTKQVAFLTSLLANLLTTIAYPALIFSLILNDLKQRQARRFIESKIGSIESIIAQQMKRHPKENQDEQRTESDSETKQS